MVSILDANAADPDSDGMAGEPADDSLGGALTVVKGIAGAAINLLAAPMFFPGGTACFTLSLDGFGIVGAFTKVTGLSMTLEYETIREGGENDHQVFLPKGVTWEPIMLSRALALSSDIFGWMKDNSGYGLEAGKRKNMIKGRNLSITAFSMHSPLDAVNSIISSKLPSVLGNVLDFHAPIRTWNVENAFPVKWEGPHFDAAQWIVVGESLTIVHDGFVEGGLGSVTGGLLG